MRRPTSLALASAIALFEPALAQTTVLASVGENGEQGNSSHPSISADGRFVVFHSPEALVPEDANGWPDVYVRDLQLGTTRLVSVASDGTQGQRESMLQKIAADGRFVVFWSKASNLVPGDVNGVPDYFVRDLQDGTTELVTVSSTGVQANALPQYWSPVISADGRWIAFASPASNLAPGDTNGTLDIFLRDRLAGTTEIVSLGSNGTAAGLCLLPALSDDGRYVAFCSAAGAALIGIATPWTESYVRDRLTGTTELVSASPSGGPAGGGGSTNPVVSNDGRWIAFTSGSAAHVAGDTNGQTDIFLRDRTLGTTQRISLSSNGAQANEQSLAPTISPDGRYVAYLSRASNLVVGDTNGADDIFLFDGGDSLTERVSLTFAGQQGSGNCGLVAMSRDGRRFAFDSVAHDLVPEDANGPMPDVFLRDRGPTFAAFCAGSVASCPCGNGGSRGQGCENSHATGGASLAGHGAPSLAVDSLRLSGSGLPPAVPCLVLQGRSDASPAPFGDGLLCVGEVVRLYVAASSGGELELPPPASPVVSQRSAALGDTITAGSSRHYQVVYRDTDAAFCAPPLGGSWNASSALTVVWSY